MGAWRKFKLGATTVTLGKSKPGPIWSTKVGYARIAGVYFDTYWLQCGVFWVNAMRLRDNDIEHPRCNRGYLWSDVVADPSLPLWGNP